MPIPRRMGSDGTLAVHLPRTGARAGDSSHLQLPVYVAAVAIAGLSLLAALLRDLEPLADVRRQGETFWVLAVLLVLTQTIAVRVPRTDGLDEDRVSASSAATFALLVVAELPLVIVVQACASLLASVVHRRPPWRAMFDVAQYSLSLACAGAVLGTGPRTGAASALDVVDLPEIALAAVVFFVVTDLLGTGLAALAEGVPLVTALRRDLGLQASTMGIALCLAPVLVLAGETHVALVVSLLLPLAAVYRSALLSMDKKRQALHDLLTGLPNRTLFVERADRLLAAGDRIAVALLDLDQFRDVNDTLGHQAGDTLLRAAAARLVDEAGPDAVVARIAGDEYAAAFRASDDAEAVERTERLRRALERTFVVERLTVDLEASAGVAMAASDAEGAERLLQRADMALHSAKDRRAGVEVYTDELDSSGSRRLSLLGDLRRALDDPGGQLVLHYQPKVEIATGEVRAVEALLRWQHPVRGMVPPGEFVPLAEHTGLIKPLTLFVLEQAVAQAATWRTAGLHVGVAVNLSARNLHDRELPAQIAWLLVKHETDPADLILEITESAVMTDPDQAMNVLDRLASMGVKLSIDDFGTGYSSLAYLKRLPVCELKVDRSFVQHAHANADDAIILASTVELGRKFGLRVVAEGVETEAALDHLRRLGCDDAQGYFLSPPLPADDLVAWLGRTTPVA